MAFNAAITACEKAQRWEFAIELLEMMTRATVSPDVVTFNATVPRQQADGGTESLGECLREESTVESEA